MLTGRERERIVDYLFDSEVAFLVENIMNYVPEDILRSILDDAVDEETDDETDEGECNVGIR